MPAAPVLTGGGPLSLRAAATAAWLYCLPLVEMAAARGRVLARRRGLAANTFSHVRTLSGPANRLITTPNNDTLYSIAWLDLESGPITLALPPAGDRYFSLALLDMYSNNFAVLGTRTTGGDRASVVLAGPSGLAPDGALRSPTPWVWALARTLVDGEADLPAARELQDELTLSAGAGRKPIPGVGREAPWLEYFSRAQDLLRENPPPATDAALFERIAPLQLGPTGDFDRVEFSATEVAEIEAGVADAMAQLRDATDEAVGGWTYPAPALGDFGQDYDLRAAVALGGLAALPPVEAMYLRAVAPDGGFLFDGPDGWRLSLPSALPVNAFWSLTMYEATPAGQFFLTKNPADRYAIGDRTPGLTHGSGGSTDIWISRVDPGAHRSANWLPAPASGPYALFLRAYLPKPELLTGRWRVPALEAVR